MKTVAIVPAAGKGVRMGGDVRKQYLALMGKPVLYWTLKLFQECEVVDEVILVVPERDIDYCRQEIVSPSGFDKTVKIVPGGRSRQGSVANGFDSIDGPCDVVCVHDGVRPLVKPYTIVKAVRTAAHFGASCVAVPVKDTVKEITDDGFVKRTPLRRYIYAAQTPQCFEYNLYADALAQAKKDGRVATDDSSLVEAIGGRVVIVEGSYENIKITTPQDIPLAETILKSRIKGN